MSTVSLSLLCLCLSLSLCLSVSLSANEMLLNPEKTKSMVVATRQKHQLGMYLFVSS